MGPSSKTSIKGAFRSFFSRTQEMNTDKDKWIHVNISKVNKIAKLSWASYAIKSILLSLWNSASIQIGKIGNRVRFFTFPLESWVLRNNSSPSSLKSLEHIHTLCTLSNLRCLQVRTPFWVFVLLPVLCLDEKTPSTLFVFLFCQSWPWPVTLDLSLVTPTICTEKLWENDEVTIGHTWTSMKVVVGSLRGGTGASFTDYTISLPTVYKSMGLVKLWFSGAKRLSSSTSSEYCYIPFKSSTQPTSTKQASPGKASTA